MPVEAPERTLIIPDDTELEQRVAILRKLKEHLLSQRQKFREYLSLLDMEEKDIRSGDAAKLKAHTETGKAIVQEIYAFQKVIDPLEDMYRVSYPLEDRELPAIRESLAALKEEVQKRNTVITASLCSAMEVLAKDVKSIKTPGRYRNQYSRSEPSLIDITT